MKIAGNVNLRNRAVTQFIDYNFTSFCNFKGVHLSAGPSGLFTLGADDDNGTEIEAFIETILSNWGANNIKRPRFCYLEYRSKGVLKLLLIDDDLTEKSTVDVTSQSAILPQVIKFPVPRTIAKRFWKFRIINVDGADFQINGLEVFFVVRPSGLSKST